MCVDVCAYVSVCVYMYVYMYVSIYVSMYVYMYVYMYVLPFESKLLPAVLLLLRIYFPKITVTVTVLKFGWKLPFRYRLGVRSHTFISMDSQLPSWKSFELISPKLPLPLPSWNVFELER